MLKAFSVEIKVALAWNIDDKEFPPWLHFELQRHNQ
jgi:hypothetical protein